MKKNNVNVVDTKSLNQTNKAKVTFFILECTKHGLILEQDEISKIIKLVKEDKSFEEILIEINEKREKRFAKKLVDQIMKDFKEMKEKGANTFIRIEKKDELS